MPITYNPQVQDQSGQFIYQGLAGLGQGIGAAIQEYSQKQQQAQHQADLLAYNNKTNDVVMQHALTLKDPNGNPYVAPDVYAQYQAANAKDKGAIADGISKNMVTDMAMQRATPALQVLQPPPGSNVPPQTVRTGPGSVVQPPFQPTQVMVPPPANNPSGAPIGGVMTSQGQFQVVNSTPVPANANKQILGPNGQWIAYGPNGEPHPLAMNQGDFKALSDQRSQAEQAVLAHAAPNGLNLNDVGQIVQNPSSVSYVVATDTAPATKTTPKQPIMRQNTDPATNQQWGKQQVQVKPGEPLDTATAGAIMQTYGPGSVRATGNVNGKDFNMPFTDLMNATNRYQSMPPKPMMRSAGQSEPMVSVISPSGVPGFIPQSKVQAALASGYKQQ
jgi:hypothetical protein